MFPLLLPDFTSPGVDELIQNVSWPSVWGVLDRPVQFSDALCVVAMLAIGVTATVALVRTSTWGAKRRSATTTPPMGTPPAFDPLDPDWGAPRQWGRLLYPAGVAVSGGVVTLLVIKAEPDTPLTDHAWWLFLVGSAVTALLRWTCPVWTALAGGSVWAALCVPTMFALRHNEATGFDLLGLSLTSGGAVWGARIAWRLYTDPLHRQAVWWVGRRDLILALTLGYLLCTLSLDGAFRFWLCLLVLFSRPCWTHPPPRTTPPPDVTSEQAWISLLHTAAGAAATVFAARKYRAPREAPPEPDRVVAETGGPEAPIQESPPSVAPPSSPPPPWVESVMDTQLDGNTAVWIIFIVLHVVPSLLFQAVLLFLLWVIGRAWRAYTTRAKRKGPPK